MQKKHKHGNNKYVCKNLLMFAVYLINFKSRETKHANLVRNVLPAVFWTFRFQVVHQLRPHWYDTISHSLHIL